MIVTIALNVITTICASTVVVINVPDTPSLTVAPQFTAPAALLLSISTSDIFIPLNHMFEPR